eukprot:NODE_132_length_16614_cov_0.935392.p3 type:complete len:413 gc:universal NODE_132_length_16614_cov_0.935392:7150-5912(-)
MGLPSNVAVFSQAQIIQIIVKCAALMILLLQTYVVLPYFISSSRNAIVYLTTATVMLYTVGVAIGLARDLYLIDIQQLWPLQSAYILFTLSYQIFGWVVYLRYTKSLNTHSILSKVLLVWLVIESLLSFATIIVIAVPELQTSLALYMLIVVIFSQTLNCAICNILYMKSYLIPVYKKIDENLNVNKSVIVFVLFDMLMHASYIILFMIESNYMTSIINFTAALQFGLFAIITFRLQSHQDDLDTKSLPTSSPAKRQTYVDSMISDVPRNETEYSESNVTYSEYSEEGYYSEAEGRTIFERTSKSMNYSEVPDLSQYSFATSNYDSQMESVITDSNPSSTKSYQESFSHHPHGVISKTPKSNYLRANQNVESIIIFSPGNANENTKSLADSVDTQYLANKYGSLLEQFSPET